MDKYRQLSEDNLRNNLGYTLIQWVKRIHDKKNNNYNGSVKIHSTASHYSNLISFEANKNEGLKSKANIW